MTKVSRGAGAQYFLLHPNKKATMPLPVPIDEGHLNRINERMAAATSERLALESKKKDLLAPINKRLAELRQTEKDLDSERKSGQTTAEVPVEERANFEEGIVWMVRKDTGAEVPDTRRAMTHAERQTFAKPPRDGDEAQPAMPRRGEGAAEEEEDDAEDRGEGAGLGSAMLETATGSALDSIGAMYEIARDGRPDVTYRDAIRSSIQKKGAESQAPAGTSSAAPPAEPAPKPSGAGVAKASQLTLAPPLHAYSAYRFAPVGSITIYQDGRAIGTARFDVVKDALVIVTGENLIPKKVADAIADACRFGELPIPGVPGEPKPETDAPPESAPSSGDAAPAAETSAPPLKLTANDAAALRELEKAGAPLSPERIGNLTRNRRPGTTVQRLQDAGYVRRLEGGLVELTDAGRAAIPPAKPKRGKGSKAEPSESSEPADDAKEGGQGDAAGGADDAIPFGG